MADKHPHIPGRASHRPGSAPLPHPDVRGSYTRVSSSYSSHIVIVRIGGENRWTLYEKSVFYFSIPKEKNCTFVSYINKD